MKKVELLCPAGNKRMLEMAIHNGADAVYLSGIKFGARKFANNFNNEELIEAINFAHLYGVKVYVTINTLIKDNEVDEFLKYVEFLHKSNVDAVLVQDLGMMTLIRKIYPNLEVHASTQFHNHNIEDLKFLKELGVKRAVLARELSLNEIKSLNIDIEKEVFVHGALCICYSGQCLMSSIIMNRSGNRGECAGMCRLPYKLTEDDKEIETDGQYLLSTKEFCTIKNLKEILEANIDSLKIEGRMKSPEYVGFLTRLYRKAIDDYYQNKEIIIKNEDIEKLKLLFNREFTKGFLLNDNENLMNHITPNHLGVEIGDVLNVNKDKIKIKLKKEIHQGDAIRFKNNDKGMYLNFIYNERGKLINSACKDEIVYFDNKINLKEKDIVLKTIDSLLLEEINNYPNKKIPISIAAHIKLNEPIKIEFNDGINNVTVLGNNPDLAKNQSVTEEIILEKLSKLGNSIYTLEDIKLNVEKDIFVPIKEINKLRREAINKLNNARIKPKVEFIKKECNFTSKQTKITNTINILIDNEEDYIFLNNNKKIAFYTEDKTLYNKYKKNNNIYLRLPRVTNNKMDYHEENLLITDIGSINKYKANNDLYVDIYSNITNRYTVKFYKDLGIKKIGLSPELTTKETIELVNNYKNTFKEQANIEVFAYGKIELMILKHCILNDNVNKSKKCEICKKNKNYFLKDRNNEKYPIITKNCKNILLHYKTLNKFKEYQNSEITNYYVSLIGLEKHEKNKIKNYLKGW